MLKRMSKSGEIIMWLCRSVRSAGGVQICHIGQKAVITVLGEAFYILVLSCGPGKLRGGVGIAHFFIY
jgi:hypothetical protein